ncbi:MAG: hypothetical protein U9P68_08725 [Pseudomonadota bacterium]|nr:hypothetical protein [Pseudomonadota bacterium]
MLQKTEYVWPSRMRTVALAIWTTAFVLTGILGWSAWRGYQTASDAADYVSWRQEAGLAGILPAKGKGAGHTR